MTTLRDKARELFAVACLAADPAQALQAALAKAPLPRPGPGGVLHVIALGKAAIPMATLLKEHLEGVPYHMIVVTNYENARDLPGATVFAAGHPVPDENGIRAAEAVERMLTSATAADRVIALISGGGSALLPAPAGTQTLADKAEVNRLLLANGFEITEINLVRQHLSRLKGGGFLRRAAPAPVTAYILSDVVGDDLRVVASGPTVAPIGTRQEARDLLQTRGLWPRLPEPAQALLTSDAAEEPLPAAHNLLIGSNRKSLEAMVAAAGPDAVIVNDHLTGDVSGAATSIVAAATAARKGHPARLIFGGETTVTLKGSGLGGRNQELALRVAMTMPDLGRDWVFLSGGTDGRDGPTDAAGGIVDAGTTERIRAAGGSPEGLLSNNDSHAALKLAGDLLVTGATGTNVADVQILLLG
ncbi:glycerate kinase type-2 family protein [Defluviimonas sp. SAOS-178_SWC]|uniref:glycerate kinase type-2 family protein n=1 Tax=Defluviimonas sp. SAOS-178_SWC TaxID=3121287 RepID=UPI0032216355